MKTAYSFLSVLFLGITLLGNVHASTFDTNSISVASYSTDAPFNWNAYTFSRYQLWFSDDVLTGYSGELTSIHHYCYAPEVSDDPFFIDLDVYISTTNLESFGLSTNNCDANHGTEDKAKVFSGTVTYDPALGDTFTIDLEHPFYYSGSGNLLIDYMIADTDLDLTFRYFTNGGSVWDILIQENPFLGTKDREVLRTALEFSNQPVHTPIPNAFWLLGSCCIVVAYIKRAKHRTEFRV